MGGGGGYGASMKRRMVCLLLMAAGAVAFPQRSPAPLVYHPGTGWSYEPVGGGGPWRRERAQDQLTVAQAAFDQKDYGLAMKAAKWLVYNWPLSDYAPRGQYLLARCYELKEQDQKAFAEYQKLLENYPKVENYQEVLQRQFEICNRFLAGEWFKLWGYIPYPSSVDETVAMYEKLIKNGPYSDVAPAAQMKVGEARETQSRLFNDKEPFVQAAKAYEVAADRYRDRPAIAADALYKAGLAYYKQARTAEYDQSTAGQAIDTFIQFMTNYPNDARVKEAEKMIAALKAEQARGTLEIARFYESSGRWKGARIYYNEVLQLDPNSAIALAKIAEINKRLAATNP